MSSLKALVTGGAGFVGSTLSKKLLQNGYDVTIVDDLSNGKESNLPPEATFVKADLCDDKFYTDLGNQTFNGGIFHIAAQASNAISFRTPYRDMQVNQEATLKLLEYAQRTDSTRFIFTSSMSAYGEPENFPTTEKEALNSNSPYGAHKAASEAYVNIFAKEYNIKPTIFRLYTTYGGGQNLDNLDQGLLSIYLAYLVKKQPIVVKGSLERVRDIVHVSDVVEAIWSATQRDQSIGGIYNMCSGQAYTIREILNELISQFGEDPKTYPVEVQEGTPGDPFTTHGSYQAAEKDLEWTPKVKPFDGIRMTVEAFRARQ